MALPNFYRQPLYQSTKAYTLGGGPYVFDVPRETVIERIHLFVEGVFSGAAATASVEGLAALAQSVTLRGSMAGEPSVQPINGLSGPDLFQAAQFHRGSIPHVVGSLGSAAKFRVTIPLYFQHPFFTFPQNLMAALPAYKMSDLTLTVNGATQAQLDSNATPTLAITSAVIGIEVFGFYRNTIPEGLPFLRSEWGQLQDDTITTSATREVKLPAGGDYTMLLVRSFYDGNTKQAETASAPFTQPPGVPLSIFDIAGFPKLTSSFLAARAENLALCLDSLVAGNMAFVWNRGQDQVFQTGQIGMSLNNIKFQYDATANSGAKVRFVWNRLFDPTNLLGIAR
jgi:hypothetical protein